MKSVSEKTADRLLDSSICQNGIEFHTSFCSDLVNVNNWLIWCLLSLVDIGVSYEQNLPSENKGFIGPKIKTGSNWCFELAAVENFNHWSVKYFDIFVQDKVVLWIETIYLIYFESFVSSSALSEHHIGGNPFTLICKSITLKFYCGI